MDQEMAIRPLSWLLVLVQLGGLLALALSGPVFRLATPGLVMALMAVALGGWAVLTVRIDRLRIFPEPSERTRLVTHGPYRLIRHPMYTSVLLFAGALLLNHFTWVRLAVWILLFGDLLLKAAHEETLMKKRFPGYAIYCQKTRRLIPFIL